MITFPISGTKARLFHIKCIDEYVKSIEVFCKAESLNSNDSFVYLGQYKTCIWYGKVSTLLMHLSNSIVNYNFLLILSFDNIDVTNLTLKMSLS